MIWEATVSYVAIDDKGNDKTVKASLVCENLGTFSEVEEKLFGMYELQTDFEVVAIKRSKIREIANKELEEPCKIFTATLTDTFTNDDGAEKEMKYIIAFFAKNMECAHSFVSEYVKQGYDMSVKEIKETKFEEVI